MNNPRKRLNLHAHLRPPISVPSRPSLQEPSHRDRAVCGGGACPRSLWLSSQVESCAPAVRRPGFHRICVVTGAIAWAGRPEKSHRLALPPSEVSLWRRRIRGARCLCRTWTRVFCTPQGSSEAASSSECLPPSRAAGVCLTLTVML